MDWSTFVQENVSNLIDKAAGAKYVQPYEIQKLQLEALGQTGYYNEGQPGSRLPVANGGINMTVVLLIGAAIVGVLLLKD